MAETAITVVPLDSDVNPSRVGLVLASRGRHHLHRTVGAAVLPCGGENVVLRALVLLGVRRFEFLCPSLALGQQLGHGLGRIARPLAFVRLRVRARRGAALRRRVGRGSAVLLLVLLLLLFLLFGSVLFVLFGLCVYLRFCDRMEVGEESTDD